jgi:hypothetical protein
LWFDYSFPEGDVNPLLPNSVDWQNARRCIGVNDRGGIIYKSCDDCPVHTAFINETVIGADGTRLTNTQRAVAVIDFIVQDRIKVAAIDEEKIQLNLSSLMFQQG